MNSFRKGLVKLNVGGEKFITYNTTLKQSKYFKDLLTMRTGIQYDQDGCIFIDRSGKIFTHVLCFLRDGKIFVKEKENLTWLKEEAVFYQIDELVVQVDKILADLNGIERNPSFLLVSMEELANMQPSDDMLLSDKYEFITTVNTTVSGVNMQKILVRVKNP